MFLKRFLVFLLGSLLFFGTSFAGSYRLDINHFSNNLNPSVVSTHFFPYYITFWNSSNTWDELCATDVVNNKTHCASDCDCGSNYEVDESLKYFIVRYNGKFYFFAKYNFGGWGWRSDYYGFIGLGGNPQDIFIANFSGSDYLFIVGSSESPVGSCFGISLDDGSYIYGKSCPFTSVDAPSFSVPFPSSNFILNLFSNNSFWLSDVNGNNFYYNDPVGFNVYMSSSFIGGNIYQSGSDYFFSSYPYSYYYDGDSLYSFTGVFYLPGKVYTGDLSGFVSYGNSNCIYTGSIDCSSSSYCKIDYSCFFPTHYEVFSASLLSGNSGSYSGYDFSPGVGYYPPPSSSGSLSFSNQFSGSCPVDNNSYFNFQIGGWSIFGFKIPSYRPFSPFTCLFSIFTDAYTNPYISSVFSGIDINYTGSVYSWIASIPTKSSPFLLGDVILFFVLLFFVSFYFSKKK